MIMDDFWGHFWAAVQALGAVVAIGWAIWLWRRDRLLADERRDARARVLAFRLMPILLDISMAIDLALKALDQVEPKVSSEPFSKILLAINIGVKLPPPPPENLFNDFDCLAPDLARTLSHLFYSTDRFNRYAKDILAVIEKAPGENLPEMFPSYRKRLGGLQHDYGTCAKLLLEQFGDVLGGEELKGQGNQSAT